ncbi:MAG: hypothetical protein PHV34_23135 [Verrucomicrobiae bacterium]|nr:hypothetical protein [Verrucomicrobiae bacterium]
MAASDLGADDLKAREERKRWNMQDPVARWKQIQEMIAWAEAQLPPEKRRNRPRWKEVEGRKN